MLDVGPEEMTKAAAEMQAQGMIRCSHGMVTVLDRRRLETQVRECYAVVRHEYERLLSPGAILSSVAV